MLRPAHSDPFVQSLRMGVPPRIGLQHVQVGRAQEIASIITDLDRIAEGGAAFRVVVGEYGAGKTFFLNLVRAVAHEKKLVTVHADLSPERRIHATGGQARSLYAELMRNLATRTRADGGALPNVVDRFVVSASEKAAAVGQKPEQEIQTRLRSLEEMVGGYDFAAVISCYWRGHMAGDEELMRNAERWLRAEFSTKTEARQALGVRTIIDDESLFDNLKLMARFTRLAGFSGLLVCLDEMVNIYKLPNSQARNANYEQILKMLNGSMQGASEGLGFLLGGTPEFLLDPRRGLFSYQALASRLGENVFAASGFVDHSGPILRLQNLTPEDLYVLLGRLRHVFAYGDESRYLVPDEAFHAFMDHCDRKIGDAYFRTPRLTIKAFLDMLAILDQNPEADWSDLVQRVAVAEERDPDIEDDDELATTRI